MKIGNIVSNTKENVSEDFNVVTSMGEVIQGLPTLIVGWDYIKTNYPKYNMIDRSLGDNTFWTFKKTENRELHDEDLYKFSIATYKGLVKNVKYHFVDLLMFPRNRVKKFLKLWYESDTVGYRHIEITRNIDMIYLLIGSNDIVGIDLNLFKLIGFDKEKFIKHVRKHTRVFLEGNHIFIEYEKGLEYLDKQVKFIPFLYTIKNG